LPETVLLLFLRFFLKGIKILIIQQTGIVPQTRLKAYKERDEREEIEVRSLNPVH